MNETITENEFYQPTLFSSKFLSSKRQNIEESHKILELYKSILNNE
jgi:hypothetical protein